MLRFFLPGALYDALQRKGPMPLMKSLARNRTLRANGLLLLTALIWGLAFVAQDVAMDSLPPFTFNGIRMLLAGVALMPCIALLQRFGRAPAPPAPKEDGEGFLDASPWMRRKTLWVGGGCCGVALFLGSSLQQVGLQYTSAGKAGFITTLYIVLVPIAGLFLGRRVRPHVWAAVFIALGGLFLLCVTDALTIHQGDVYLILSAACFTGHILVVDYFAPRADCLRMSCIQFLVTAALCAIPVALWEQPTLEGLRGALVPILYTGILSGAVGYTLQIIGQRDTSPTVASLLMCMESVFAVLAAWVLLGDTLTPRELGGCAALLVGVVLAQLPGKGRPEAAPEGDGPSIK